MDMANSNSQRVAAFLLAAVFLVTTIGATAYVVVQINNDESGLVNETAEEKAIADQLDAQREAEAAADGQELCGQKIYAAVEPRSLPSVTTSDAVDELETIDVKEGDGEEVQPGDCVAALYYGTLASDGTMFDGNYETGQPIEFPLTGVIQGWTEGIPGMKVGGVRRLVIPADQAYGEQERSGIPANSDLIFEVEIISTRRGDS
jgi:peptidylprolyl isomerase